LDGVLKNQKEGKTPLTFIKRREEVRPSFQGFKNGW